MAVFHVINIHVIEHTCFYTEHSFHRTYMLFIEHTCYIEHGCISLNIDCAYMLG